MVFKMTGIPSDILSYAQFNRGMTVQTNIGRTIRTLMALGFAAYSVVAMSEPSAPAVDWQAAKSLGEVDERFQSFNVEMVEVTGGRFWAPYASNMEGAPEKTSAKKATPVDQRRLESFADLQNRPGAQTLFEFRTPLDFNNNRLRNLTRAISPAYMRVSGTWANKTFFDENARSSPPEPPAGFESVLTAKQWDGANRFAKDLDLEIMTSFAISPGTRDTNGKWTTDNARKLIEYSVEREYPLAAAEIINEPNTGEMAGIPKDYTAAAFRDEFGLLKLLRDELIPTMLLAGPGTSANNSPLTMELPVTLSPSGESILEATAPAFDIVSYHFYPATSVRCAAFGMPQTSKDVALTEPFLALTEQEARHFKMLRDRFEPGKPIWLTEVAGAACGGNPWAIEFIDAFRYVEQLGRLAKLGVQVVMHNTLSASDYGLIDDVTLEPRPTYWAAVLWRQLVGERVLDLPLTQAVENASVYAHCLRGHTTGGVALVLVNRNQEHSIEVDIGASLAERYELTASSLASKQTLLNGTPLSVDAEGRFVSLKAVKGNGRLSLKPASINYLSLPDIDLPACR